MNPAVGEHTMNSEVLAWEIVGWAAFIAALAGVAVWSGIGPALTIGGVIVFARAVFEQGRAKDEP
jgi:hypothetical protein